MSNSPGSLFPLCWVTGWTELCPGRTPCHNITAVNNKQNRASQRMTEVIGLSLPSLAKERSPDKVDRQIWKCLRRLGWVNILFHCRSWLPAVVLCLWSQSNDLGGFSVRDCVLKWCRWWNGPTSVPHRQRILAHEMKGYLENTVYTGGVYWFVSGSLELVALKSLSTKKY